MPVLLGIAILVLTVANGVLLALGLVFVKTLFAILLSFSMVAISCHRIFLFRLPRPAAATVGGRRPFVAGFDPSRESNRSALLSL